MTRTILRTRSTLRAAALGALVLALAAGCGSTGQGEDATAPDDGPSTSRDSGGDSDDAAPADDATAEDTTAEDESASEDDADGQDGSTAQAPAEDADLATEELPIGAERAVEIATGATGGGDLVKIEIDHDDRVWEWEVEIVEGGTEHQLDIDATTGEITEHETDEEDDQDPAVDVTAPMGYSEAIEIALGQEPGRVSGWELDSDDGTVRYRIDIDRENGGDVEVEVDVETGEVGVDD